MPMISICALLLAQLPPIRPFVAELRTAIASGNQTRIEKLFKNASDDAYLFRMGQSRGLRNFKVSVIPAPPGWEASGSYWAVVHARQDIEDYHDPVYPIVVSGVEWKLGSEIAEDAPSGLEIKSADLFAHLLPSSKSVRVRVGLHVSGPARLPRAAVFRLNDNFALNGTAVISEGPLKPIDIGDEIPSPKPNDVIRAGSLIVPWTRTVGPLVQFGYSAVLDSKSEDKIDERAAYVTAWWVPSLGRLPFTTTTRIVGPKDWTLQSEGVRVPSDGGPYRSEPAGPGEQVANFRCDVPISFPKVIGGRYVLAAEKKTGGRTYRAYHFDPIDKARAEKDVQTIADTIAWYDQHLVPFPFNEYSVFDADTYYGIESYSYTLLNSRITSWAVSHEAGHTYFGGLVPCTYVHDTWNESMTQYVDSVLRQNNADRTLEGALSASALRTAVPLTDMPVAHEYGSLTYTRGAYVLRMLENQIGIRAMEDGMRAIIRDRPGRETTWYDLRPYFEKASGMKLEWFWRQWILGATFPKLEVVDAEAFPSTSGTSVHVTVRQTGTSAPFRVRFKVIARGRPDISKEQIVEMDSPEATFTLNVGKGVVAYEAALDTFGYVLAPRVTPAKVKL